MDNIPEREQPKSEIRGVSLGQEFHPFDPKYSIDRKHAQFRDRAIVASIQLNIEDTNFPLEIKASNRYAPVFNLWGMCITPFDHELGYQINSDDLNLATRREKIKRLGGYKLSEHINSEKAPYLFNVSANGMELNEVGLNKKRAADKFQFSKDTIDFLRKLRLHVFFPKLRFEGKIHEQYIKDGCIAFFNFYPADTGPLPEGKYQDTGADYWFTQDGLLLALPSNPEKLAQIRARFVMVEE